MKMNNSKTNLVGHWWVLATVVIGAALLNPSVGFDQETKSASPATAAKAEAPAKSVPAEPAAKDAEKTAALAAEKTQEKSSATAKPNESATGTSPTVKAALPEEKTPRSTAAAGTEEKVPSKEGALPAGKTMPSVATKVAQDVGLSDQGQSGSSPWLLLLTIIALIVVSIMAGNYLAKVWRMPDHAWKMSLVIGAFAASILCCLFLPFKFGPDLAGGITLIYELAEAPTVAEQPAQPGGNPSTTGQIKSGGREFKLDQMVQALKKRVDPDGTKEITIRGYGQSALEIIIPQVGQDEMESVKQRIIKIGQLEFRITADPTMTKDQEIIKLAKLMPPGQKDVMRGENKVAEWVPYDVKAFGPVEREDNMVKRLAGDTPEVLVLMDPFNVTGEYLTRATKGPDETGGPAVHFSFNQQGASRFEKLTGQNKPNPATPEVYRHLGIILDKMLMNAPVIRSTISSEGTISGGSMTDKEVERHD